MLVSLTTPELAPEETCLGQPAAHHEIYSPTDTHGNRKRERVVRNRRRRDRRARRWSLGCGATRPQLCRPRRLVHRASMSPALLVWVRPRGNPHPTDCWARGTPRRAPDRARWANRRHTARPTGSTSDCRLTARAGSWAPRSVRSPARCLPPLHSPPRLPTATASATATAASPGAVRGAWSTGPM